MRSLIIAIIAALVLLSATAEGDEIPSLQKAGRCDITKEEERELDRLHLVLKCYISTTGDERRGWWIKIQTKYATNGVLVFLPEMLTSERDGLNENPPTSEQPSTRIKIGVYVHGHDDSPKKMDQYRLVEGSLESGFAGIMVVPVGLLDEKQSDWGALSRGKLKELLIDVLNQLAALPHPHRQLIPQNHDIGEVAVFAHSGGSRGAESLLSQAVIPIALVGLLDALHKGSPGEFKKGTSQFLKWLAKNPNHRLWEAHSPGYKKLYDKVRKFLPESQVSVTPGEKGTSHNGIVAKVLPGWLTDWGKKQQRPLFATNKNP